jgi:hypothetical protein
VTLRIELLDICEDATSVPPVPRKLWLIWTMIAKPIRHRLWSRPPPDDSWRTPFCSRKCVDRFKAAAKVTTSGWAGSNRFRPSRPKTAQGRHDASDLTTRQRIFEDSADFTSHCQNHDGPSIATQLKALADDYERRAEKASLDDAKHYSIRCSR